MTDYTELIKALRCCDEYAFCNDCPIFETCDGDVDKAMAIAADAIEALQSQLPKRGEWIVDGMYTYNLRELNGKAYEPVYRCSCCNRQMESYLRLDEPKMPEDADFPEYCPHCGAKMEVQDADT